ncbi:hypothetical protein PMAYCL1PPCAC_21141, partial [Pristionchus mayeri]
SLQEYFRVRREFLEHRRAYQSIFSTKTAFTLAELTEIERKWNKLRISLDMAAARADHASLPHELAELSEWIAQGRALLNSHIKLAGVEPSKDRLALHQALTAHNKHFSDLHRRREILEVHGVEVTAEQLEPLKLRMDNIAEEAPSRAATLRALLAHATSRAYIAELEDKMRLWQSADSLALLNRWIKEYKQLAGENPRAKCAQHLDTLKRTTAADPTLDGPSMVAKVEQEGLNTLKRFDGLLDILLKLRLLWTGFEEELWRLEELAVTGLRTKQNTLAAESDAVSALEAQAEQLAPLLSTSARLAIEMRLAQLLAKKGDLAKMPVYTTRLVVELGYPSTSKEPVDVTMKKPVTHSSQVIIVLKTIEERLKQLVSSSSQRPEFSQKAQQMELQRRSTNLKTLRPVMEDIEARIEGLKRSDNPDMKEELANTRRLVYALAGGPFGELVDTSEYKKQLDDMEERKTVRVQLSPEYISKIVIRLRTAIDRHETNEREVEETEREVEECLAILGPDVPEEVKTAWRVKRDDIFTFRRVKQQLEEIEAGKASPSLRELHHLGVLLSRLDTLPLSSLPGARLEARLSASKERVERETERKLKQLEMAGEEEVSAARELLTQSPSECLGESAALRQRRERVLRSLDTKMDLFRRLQAFYDAVKFLRSRAAAHNTITVDQRDSVASEIRDILSRADSEWRRDAERLKAEVVAIQGSFFQLEFDRVNEKLSLLIHDLEKLLALNVRRKDFLDALEDFLRTAEASVDFCSGAAATSTTPERDRENIELITNELCENMETKGVHLMQLQQAAEMTVAHFSVPSTVKKFRRRQLGDQGEPTFEDLYARLTALVDAPKLNEDDFPGAHGELLQRVREAEAAEAALLEDIESAPTTTEEQAKRLLALKARLADLQHSRKQLALRVIRNYLDIINAR